MVLGALVATVVPPPLVGRRIAFTTPPSYATRLARLLSFHGAVPLHLPSIVVGPTEATLAALGPHLHALDAFSALALVSRSSISAVAAVLPPEAPLSEAGPAFTVAALGSDSELLYNAQLPPRLCRNPERIRVLVPEIASPSGLVASLGEGLGEKILCPVPEVVELAEPPVVPDFLRDLEEAGWAPVRVPAYETRWAGPACMEGLVGMAGGTEDLDAVIFTSSAEVEGMLKGLERLGWDWNRVKLTWPNMVVGAHGPVTAGGAERLGVVVDVVSSKFSSFNGILDALASWWAASKAQR